MNKQIILETYDQPTGITFKHNPVYVGDVYADKDGNKGVVTSTTNPKTGEKDYWFDDMNGCKPLTKENRTALTNRDYVANVIQDEELMKHFENLGIIKDEPIENKQATEVTLVPPPVVEEVKTDKLEVDEIKPKKEVKKLTEKKTKNIYQKINEIRQVWQNNCVEKDGNGKAGGGARYQYYTPEQVTDFVLQEEVKRNLFSQFEVTGEFCSYTVFDIDDDKMKKVSVQSLFTIPKKMAASEAQQVGAAITYFERRLKMLMYNMVDNSKESVDIMKNADYVEKEIPAPAIPVAPAPAPQFAPQPIKQSVPTPAPTPTHTPAPTTVVSQPTVQSATLPKSPSIADYKPDTPTVASKSQVQTPPRPVQQTVATPPQPVNKVNNLDDLY